MPRKKKNIIEIKKENNEEKRKINNEVNMYDNSFIEKLKNQNYPASVRDNILYIYVKDYGKEENTERDSKILAEVKTILQDYEKSFGITSKKFSTESI